MALDYFTQMQLEAFKKRCKALKIKFTMEPSVKGDIITFEGKGKRQKYLIPVPAFSWIPAAPQEIPMKLNGFLDQFIQEISA
jgi:hypothetical protein